MTDKLISTKNSIKNFFKETFDNKNIDIIFYIGLILLLTWMPLSYGARYITTQVAGQVICSGLLLILLREKNKNIYKYPLWAISMFWLGILFISTVLSITKLASIEEIMRNIMYISLAIAVFSWSDIKNKMKLLSYTILSSGLVVSIYGIINFFMNYYETISFSPAAEPFGRTNDLGAYMLLIFPLSLSNFLYENENKFEKSLYALVTILTSITIILTFSRGIWLSTIIAICLILSLGRKILKKNLIYLGIVGVISLIPLVIKWDDIVTRFLSLQNIFNNAENSIEWRKSLITSTFDMFIANPVIGTGLNTFPFVFSAYQEKAGYFSVNPHNYYLQLLAETGIMGFISFIVLVLSILYMSFKAFKNSENIFKGIALGLLVAIISSLIHISVDIDWSVLSIPMVFWIEVGLLIAIYNSVNFKETRFTEVNNRFDYIKKWVLGVFAVGLLIIPTMNYLSIMQFSNAMRLSDDLYLKNNIIAAKKYNERAMMLAPYPSSKHNYNYSLLLTKEKNYPEALKYSYKAISLDPYNYNFYKLNSELILKNNPKDYESALESLKKAVKYNPYAHPKLYKQVGDFYVYKLNNLPEGIKWYMEGVNKFPLEQLSHYETYTPDDRFQLYSLYKQLGVILGNSDKSKDYKKLSDLMLNSQPRIESPFEENTTPTNTIINYWKYLYKRDISYLTQKNDNVFLPPPGYDYNFVDFINIEHNIFKVKIEYKIQMSKNGQKMDLVIIDELVPTNEGWIISARYKKENDDI